MRSQQRAQAAWAEGRFEREVLPIDAADRGEDGESTTSTHRVERDEGLRETSLEALAALKPIGGEDGVHTAGTSSQISDGAAAVLLTSAARAEALGVRPRARIVDQCLVGVDPVLMLTGPIDATRLLFDRTGLAMGDLDTIEINEAFASVVLAWALETRPDMDIVNPNDRRPAGHHRAARAGTHRRALRPHHDVLRRWVGHRDDHRAAGVASGR